MASQPNTKTETDWAILKKGLVTQKNFEMLINRVAVLSREKDSRLKQIENTQKIHQRMVLGRIEKEQAKRQVSECIHSSAEYIMNRTQSTFMRESHRNNMQRIRNHLRTLKLEEVRRTKQQSLEIERIRKQEQRKAQEEKKRRNNLMKIQHLVSRERIDRFWDCKLKELKEQKRQETSAKLIRMHHSLQQMEKLEKAEEVLIQELVFADKVKEHISKTMEQEKKLSAIALIEKYSGKGIPEDIEENKEIKKTGSEEGDKEVSKRDQKQAVQGEGDKQNKEHKFKKISVD